MASTQPALQVWNIAQIAAAQDERFGEFFRIPAMSFEIYKLPAGGVDPQNPHQEDEAYYVISGKAKIEVEGEIKSVEAGSLIFVAARARHKFIEIEEDLALLVFFAPAFTGS